ncbi:MAG: DUF4332 domain-containing protein [Saprospirales bacterium]|jgi:predicted flap endonuclease-1-like 5' DNA nuclease|nr:DUF4332 domain-containing protein [Saprospirales bacterium]
MLLNYILLHVPSFMDNLPTGLALCIVPFILGFLAAYAYYKVGALRADNAALNVKVSEQINEITGLRIKIAQLESDLETKGGEVRKAKDALIMCESERNALREQAGGGTTKVKSAAKPAEARTITFNGVKYKWDDLKIVEGIGPKIAELLQAAGISTWEQLSMTSPYRLREILDAGGSQFNIHDPESWPHQADLAAHEKWDELKKLQEELDGGRAV